MYSVTDWKSVIDCQLIEPIKDFAYSREDIVQVVFLTGSYVRGSFNNKRPNVNIYFISESGKVDELRFELSILWQRITQTLRNKNRIDFVVDCHPYTISQRGSDYNDFPLLTLTTKVFDGAQYVNRYNLPTIGTGWMLSYEILYGDVSLLDPLREQPVKDIYWLKGAYEALTHYYHVLEHLPWALNMDEWPDRFVEESVRYAEESLRDGISIVLSENELIQGKAFDIIHNWKEKAEPFFLNTYGKEGVWAVRKINEWKEIIGVRENYDSVESKKIWFDCLKVWKIVWNRYCKVVEEIAPEQKELFCKVSSWF